MLNCPHCGGETSGDGQGESWRDAARRWRDYARTIEDAVEEIEKSAEAERKRADAWRGVAAKRLYLLRVAHAKLTGEEAPPIPGDEERPDVAMRQLGMIAETTNQVEEAKRAARQASPTR